MSGIRDRGAAERFYDEYAAVHQQVMLRGNIDGLLAVACGRQRGSRRAECGR
ncbi:hypothetical protein NRF20_04855 [Streptomyces sp. R-74717]|uniref:hypothetical protein n=1 Tax=Streptomyces TaxID=1883 RepID=UPI00379E323C